MGSMIASIVQSFNDTLLMTKSEASVSNALTVVSHIPTRWGIWLALTNLEGLLVK